MVVKQVKITFRGEGQTPLAKALFETGPGEGKVMVLEIHQTGLLDNDRQPLGLFMVSCTDLETRAVYAPKNSEIEACLKSTLEEVAEHKEFGFRSWL